MLAKRRGEEREREREGGREGGRKGGKEICSYKEKDPKSCNVAHTLES